MKQNETRRALMLGLAAISMAGGSARAGEADDLYAAMQDGMCEPATVLQARNKAGAVATQAAPAMAYLYGTCEKRGMLACFGRLRTAAEQGEADLRGAVGHAYSQGYGVPKDEAGRWTITRRSIGDARRRSQN